MQQVRGNHGLPGEVSSFLRAHPDAQVAVVEEPHLSRVPPETVSPLLAGFDEAPLLSSFGRSTHAAVIQATRAARLDGTTHIPVVLFGQPQRLTLVSLVGEPHLLLLLHPAEGIGPMTDATDSSDVTIYRGICDSQTQLISVGDVLAEAANIDPADCKHHVLSSLVHPDSAADLLDCWADSAALGASSCAVRIADTVGGGKRSFQATLIANGEQTNFVFVDATDNPRAQRSQEHRNRLDTISEMVPQGIFRVGEQGKLLYKNSKLDDIFGRKLVDQNDFADVRTTTGEPVYSAVPRILEELDDDECMIDVPYIVDGGNRMIRLHVRKYLSPLGEPEFVGSAEDITAEVERSSQLETEALTDPMTGTANRRGLELTIGELIDDTRKPRFAVLLCDLDGFKQVNDSLGHGAGDDVIAEVGRRLKEVSRDVDTVARLGGDEFVVVARNVNDYDHAMELAQRILPVLRTPFSVADTQIELSGSVGVAISSEGSTMLGILQQADHAMYEAKRSGRNQAVAYETPSEKHGLSPLALRRDLRRAIAQNGLDLAFQPIYAIHDLENPVSAESLLRWDHPLQGRIDPSSMITIAEQSGLIRELGEWIVTESIRSAAAVNQAREANEKPISINVNVSTLQVGRRDFGDTVLASLDFHELDPNLLIIELTETFLIDRVDNAREAVETLTAAGVRFAVDDFGTSTSSFEYLLTLPLHAVKVDDSFTKRLGTERGAAMLRGLASACRELDMMVIAEGIETFDELSAARRAGVTHAQGYLLGMPVSTSGLGIREAGAA